MGTVISAKAQFKSHFLNGWSGWSWQHVLWGLLPGKSLCKS